MFEAIANALTSGDHTGLLLLAILLAVAVPLALLYLFFLVLRRFVLRNGHDRPLSRPDSEAALMLQRAQNVADETAKRLDEHLKEAEPALREFGAMKDTVARLELTCTTIQGEQRHQRDILIAVAVKLGAQVPQLEP
jgi:hypothetical protein